MKHYKVKSYARQAGMTLIELSVVLLILVGLAGLLIPYVGSFTQTTHDSTNSNNVTQLNNAFLRYTSEKNRLPPHVDTLINSADATAIATGTCVGAKVDTVYCGLANPGLFVPLTIDPAVATDKTKIESISNSGISMAVANDPDIENKTFGTSTGMLGLGKATDGMPFNAAVTVAAVAAGNFASDMMSSGVEKHLAAALGRDAMAYNDTCYDYIAVGIGDNNELIQSTAAAAPVFFPQDAKFGPTQAYGHFIAILQVDKDNDTVTNKCSGLTEKAKFLGVVANVPTSESTTLVGANTLLAQGWKNRESGNN